METEQMTTPSDVAAAVQLGADPMTPYVYSQLRRSQRFGKLAMAKCAAQGEFMDIARSKLAEIRSQKGNFEYTFADLAAVIEAVIPSLTKHGLALFTPITNQDFKAMEVTATIMLVHGESEQWMECDYKAAIADSIDPRKVGSAATYARRYGTLALLGINPRDEDDDADDADTARPRQAARDVSRPNVDDHPNAPPASKPAPAPAPAPSPRTSETPAPPAAETRSVPFDTGGESPPAEDAFFATLLKQLETAHGFPVMTGWAPDDLIEEWVRRLGTIQAKPDLNKFAGPCISAAKTLGTKSSACATVATRMAAAFNEQTKLLTNRAAGR